MNKYMANVNIVLGKLMRCSPEELFWQVDAFLCKCMLHCSCRAQGQMVAAKQRGGAHHKPKPPLDVNVVFSIFTTFRVLLKNMGTYETIPRSFKANGKGLLELYEFMKPLLEVCPSCLPNEQTCRLALQRLAAANPVLLADSPYNSLVWANMKLSVLTTVCYHLRRLKREPVRMEQVCLTLTGIQIAKLQELLELIHLDPEDSHFCS